MKRYLVILFICALYSVPAFAEETAITIDFAKQMSEWDRNGGEQGAQLVKDALDNLNRKELQKLEILIKNDMRGGAGIIVNPPLPVEYRFVGHLLNMIDDRLGVLKYNLVAEGWIIGQGILPATVSEYFFKPKYGPTLDIYIDLGTIMPAGNYDDIIYKKMRIFVWVYRGGGGTGEILRAVQKVELIEDDPAIDNPYQWP